MNGAQFVADLKAENEVLLAKIDRRPGDDGAADAEIPTVVSAATLATLMKMALKNEMEAAEIAAEWVPSTPEIEAKLALAQHCGDEARHYQLVEAQVRATGIALEHFNPLDPPSPVLSYLRTLNTTVERVAAALVAREAMGGRRNAQFLNFLEDAGQRGLADLYRNVINPDEERHHLAGCELLAVLATAPASRDAARRAARGLLETGDRVRAAALEATGAPAIPGC